jgi:Domain of unknown function (DUF4112)
VKEVEKPAPSPLAVAPSAGAPVPDWARRLSALLDNAIRIPGTDLRIGLDPILGALLPELGDALTAVLSLTLLGVAFRQRVPKLVLARMLINIAIDALLGAVPVIGDIFDFAFKANEKNLELIERHRGDPTARASVADWLVVAGVVLAALVLALVPVVVGVLLFGYLSALRTH